MADACLSNELPPIAGPCVWLRLNRHQFVFVGLCGGRPPLRSRSRSRIENLVRFVEPTASRLAHDPHLLAFGDR